MGFEEWWEELSPILGNKSKADAKWAWNAALEEAAKVAENDSTDCDNADHHVGCGAGYYISTAIRSLKEE